MQTINLSAPLLALNGTTATATTLAATLADILAQQTTGDHVTMEEWYKSLTMANEISIDEKGLSDLKAILVNDQRLFMYVRWQLLAALK